MPISYWWSIGTESLSLSSRFQDIRPQSVFTDTRPNERTNKHDGSQYLLVKCAAHIEVADSFTNKQLLCGDGRQFPAANVIAMTQPGTNY